MKATRVTGIDPEASTADGLERIVRVRLGELESFVPRVLDPGEVEAQHDMRIAAKRLRYLLELSEFCFGPYAARAARHVKEIQDLLGEIHDCDVMLPRVERHAALVRARDAETLVDRAAGAGDLSPRLATRAPSRAEHRGLGTLAVHLAARRALLHGRFVAHWAELQRRGFSARLEWALGERPVHDLASTQNGHAP
jgi:CHAD domain-containing protein